MAVVGVVRFLIGSGLAAGVALVTPSQLVIEHIPGFVPTGDPAVDLTFEEFAALDPDAVDHLEPDSEEATGLVAAIGTWNGAGSTVVVELVLAVDEGSATTFVDQTAATAIAVGLAATDPPFVGAWSYSGGIDDWTNVVSWNQGPYAVTMTQRSTAEVDRRDLDAAAVRQAETILESTGIGVSDDAAIDDDAPAAPTEAPPPVDAPPVDDAGGPLVWLVVALAAVSACVLVLFRRRRGATVDA